MGTRTHRIPEVDGHLSQRLPRGQPAGNTQASCFSASRVWSSLLWLEFSQKAERRGAQQGQPGSRVVSSPDSLELSLFSTSLSAKPKGYWSRLGLVGLGELSHSQDRRAAAINYPVFKDGFLKPWLWAWSLYLYLSQEYFSNT